MNLARASYLGMALYMLSLGLMLYLHPGFLAAGAVLIGSLALTVILSRHWRVGLNVLIVLMLVTFLVAMALLALGSFSLLPVAALQFVAVGCLDNRATGECSSDLALARLRP